MILSSLPCIDSIQLISIIITLLVSIASSLVIFMHVSYYWINKLKSRRKIKYGKLTSFPLVSIFIPIKNEPLDLVLRILNSISNQNYPKDKIEVIIVSDDEESYFKKIKEYVNLKYGDKLDVKIYHRSNPTGFKAGALNYALRKSNGKYVFIFDVDAIFKSDFLEKIVSFLEYNDDVDGVAVKWIPYNANSTPIAEAQAISLEYLTSIFFDGKSKINFPIIIPGCGCAFRRNALIEVNGWNENCLAEDIDLSVRLILKGKKLAYLDDVNVKIENPESYEAFKKQQARWIYGSTKVLLKYFPKLIRAKIPFLWKIDITLYLLQYHILLANFIFISLALSSIIIGADLLIPSIYFSPFLMALLALQAYSYYDAARKLGLNNIRSIIIMGRCTAMAAVLAPIVLIQNLKLIFNLREKWHITPKGPLARSIRSSNIIESLCGFTSSLLALILFNFGFKVSALCLLTFSLPYLYVSWKISKGSWQ